MLENMDKNCQKKILLNSSQLVWIQSSVNSGHHCNKYNELLTVLDIQILTTQQNYAHEFPSTTKTLTKTSITLNCILKHAINQLECFVFSSMQNVFICVALNPSFSIS